jgi:hypothetical protein
MHASVSSTDDIFPDLEELIKRLQKEGLFRRRTWSSDENSVRFVADVEGDISCVR